MKITNRKNFIVLVITLLILGTFSFNFIKKEVSVHKRASELSLDLYNGSSDFRTELRNIQNGDNTAYLETISYIKKYMDDKIDTFMKEGVGYEALHKALRELDLIVELKEYAQENMKHVQDVFENRVMMVRGDDAFEDKDYLSAIKLYINITDLDSISFKSSREMIAKSIEQLNLGIKNGEYSSDEITAIRNQLESLSKEHDDIDALKNFD